ncbi:hypothetical protein N8920_07175 [Opitutales bacterium]|nr:hypothetical protein [Opitutales bacterium]
MKKLFIICNLFLIACSQYPAEIICPMELKSGYLCEYPIDRGELDVLYECPKCKTPIEEVLDMWNLIGQ